jgi:O-antigen/teichoic acid export membrane protein
VLLAHSSRYLLARGVPGIVNFAALALYTRLLTPSEFGLYALVVAGVGLAQVVGFQWLQLVLGRFLPDAVEAPQRFLAEIAGIFGVLALGAVVAGAAAPFFAGSWSSLVLLAVPVLVTQAWLELNLMLASMELQSKRYGLLLAMKTVVALAIGVVLAWNGAGAQAPLIGLICGNVSSAIIFGRRLWTGASPTLPSRSRAGEYLSYGLPLIVTFALVWVVSSSDRVMISWLLGASEVGVYAAGYDLAQYSLGLLLSIVQVAAYPLAVRALSHEGVAAAREQMRVNGELIVVLAWTSCAGLAALAPGIARFAVGAEFRAPVAELIPLIAVGAAIAGVKAYYLDMAFHLGRDSRPLVYIGCATALLNVLANAVFLPRFGVVGAAYANIAAYALGAILSFHLSKKAFPLPSLGLPLAKAAIVGLLTAGAAYVSAQLVGQATAALFVGLMVGVLIFLVASTLVNVAGSRTFVVQMFRRFR